MASGLQPAPLPNFVSSFIWTHFCDATITYWVLGIWTVQGYNIISLFQEGKNKAYIAVFGSHAAVTNGHFTALAQTIPIIYNTRSRAIIAGSLFFLLWLQPAKPQHFPF
jgi:hypothetical protein